MEPIPLARNGAAPENVLPRWLTKDSPQLTHFWQEKCMNDVDTFREHFAAEAPIYIALDFEGDASDDGITSVGVSILVPPLNGHQKWKTSPGELLSSPLRDIRLDDVVSKHGITSHSIHIFDQPCEAKARSSTSSSRRQEPFRYGATSTTLLACLQEQLMGILKSLNSSQPSRPLHLIGWGIKRELRALVSFCPAVLPLFARCTDLATIALRMRHNTKKERSLRDVMIALGFSRADGYTLQHSSSFKRHDPGMDAARTMATMLALMALPPGEGLVVGRESAKETEARRARRKRPSREQFPFAVRIGVTAGENLPRGLRGAEKMGDFVADRIGKRPLVVHMCSNVAQGAHLSNTHSWVCLEEVADMERLVDELDGVEVDSAVLQVRLDGPRNEWTKRDSTEYGSTKLEYDESIMDELSHMLV